MSEHTSLIHFVTELYSRVGVRGAKPLSECGEAERQMVDWVDCFLDMPWTCSIATLRMLQMCELTDEGRLELPGQCPWCDSRVAVKGFSLYSQL